MPQANRFVLHILAAVAEQESEALSKRTKAALLSPCFALHADTLDYTFTATRIIDPSCTLGHKLEMQLSLLSHREFLHTKFVHCR